MLTWFWDCIFPIQCVGCRRYGAWLCHYCMVQASQPGHIAGSELDRPILTNVYWLGEYKSTALRSAIHGLKYHGWRNLAEPLGQALANTIPGPYDWVIPIPLHRRRERERGFNQAQLLAEYLPWPTLPALERYRWTNPQAQLDRAHRQTNLLAAFRLRPEHAAQLANSTVLLVDDVFTTGATTSTCATLLQTAGCATIDVAVLARD